MKTFLFCCALFMALSACDYLSGSKTIGKTEVYVNNNEIVAENFPIPSRGISNIRSVDWGSFSFNEFDKFIYEQVKKSNYSTMYIVIRHNETDIYGHSELGGKIIIGEINVAESNKYEDFYHWNQRYNTNRMWLQKFK